MQYALGYHSSDIVCPHVTLIEDGEQDEIFDVALHHIEPNEQDAAYVESKAALDKMIADANRGLDAPPSASSDEYHPIIGVNGAAHDTLYAIVGQMRGYGVTLTLDDDSEVEAVLAGLGYDEEQDKALVTFYRAQHKDDFPVIESIPADKLERRFAKRIQIH